MKKATTPTTGFSPIRNRSNNSFVRRIKAVDDGSEWTSSYLKRITVTVMIVMSFLTTKTGATPKMVNHTIFNYEITQNDKREIKLRDNKELIRLFFIDKNDNKNDFEQIDFIYTVLDKDNYPIGYVKGIIMGICNTQSKDGKYLLAYKEKSSDGTLSEYKLCYVCKLFGIRINWYLQSVDNKSPAASVPLSEFTEYFGSEVVNKSPLMSTLISRDVKK